MIQVRKANDRGHANHGWLDTHHTFSFASYYDPQFVGFRDLVVINEDIVAPGAGFGRHGHQDMEIVTYVLEGALEHEDSMGTGSVLRPGDVQRMSAGTGVHHSEFNHSKTEPLHLLQIWISPQKEGIKPSYEEKKFSTDDKKNQLRCIVSGMPTHQKEGALQMNQEASIYAAVLESGKQVMHRFEGSRHGWVQVARGSITLKGVTLHSGDGAAISEETTLELKAQEDSEFLLFDLP